MIQRFDVIIVGGGMVGLALACGLGQAGKQVAVLEVSESPPPFRAEAPYEQRVVALNRASQTFLDHLGVWETLLSWRVSPYQAMSVWDAGGPGSIEFHARDLGEPDLGHIVENQWIQRALYERLEQLETVTWFSPVEVQRFVMDDQEVIVTLEQGDLLTAKLLVGADGGRSAVRQIAGIEFGREDYHQLGIVANVETARHHDFTAWQRFLADGVLAFLPMPDGRSSIVWSANEQRATQLMGMDDEAFRRELTVALDGRLGEVISTGPRAAFPLGGAQAKQYIQPRLALVGDAAHNIHPLAGQGVNLGFMDAAELTGILASTPRDLGSLSVLRRYERARSGENLLMQRLMESFQKLFINDVQGLGLLRGVGMNLANAVLPVKTEMMRYALGVRGGLPELARPPLH
ncbi:MAG TPA: 2-octaprenyl-3-methyl-6-methoxy-1,4-benzoquinol hydroxylase [Gammaproteobacteria bacterium]|nr:2-octaprenyl-3-methyl-6-methoxy-1,4-benzoquinol hydroxylase [Gammaproteobacteria bacterium]